MVMTKHFLVAMLMAGLLTSCSFRAKKYDDPITKDTKQPDKVLFDRAIGDIEHGRYEIARITLNTMINNYDQSEFLAKAKLAIADSWFREGATASPWRRPKPSTRISSCSIPPWKRPPNRSRRFARSPCANG